MANVLTAFFSMTGETYANGGGGFGNSIAVIRKYASGATVIDGMTVPGTQVEASKAKIQEWAKSQF